MPKTSLIDYWSPSSFAAFLSNPLAFKKRYILKVYDDMDTPSRLLGKAGHTALDTYFKGADPNEAITAGTEYLQSISPSTVDWGKTGSPEKLMKDYIQAITFYFEDMPDFHEVIDTELQIVSEVQGVDGQALPLPMKGFLDLLVRNKLGQLEIIDHKFVRGYTDGDVNSFSRYLQAMFYFHLVWAKFGEKPARMVFNECKVSKNKDNSPQLQPYVIEFEGMSGDFATFYNLYNAATSNLNLPGFKFLPNPNDMFEGQNSFEVYTAGVIGVDAPTSVKHKTEMRQFAEKQYVASVADRVENKDLTPEERIRLKLQEFAIAVQVGETKVGAAITKYTFKPGIGVSMSKIEKHANDIKIALESESVRVEAPIPGTGLVGVEVPSAIRKKIDLADVHFRPGTYDIPIGVNIDNEVVHKSIAEMPHLLVAGTTGSGKSVMLNTIITALTKQQDPSALQLVLIDPKRVELTPFSKLPHLMLPVVYEDEEIVDTLQLLTSEMDDRYKILEKAGVRSIDEYKGNMPRIVTIVDEFADLMMTSADNRSERAVIRLAQKARAVGIHLILATQRPSADVVTGLLKANIATRIAFLASSRVNSQVVLDVPGAEALTGKGDMLFMDPSKPSLQRLQALYC